MMNEQDVPIDISIKKLLDWLISRRICNRDWPEQIENIRGKIRDALLDMPEHPDMKQLLKTSHVNYYTCVKIVEILKETEKDSKSFFGSYGSQRMKDWKVILSEYENGSVYLAELAQYLIQHVVYEIPGLKKHNLKLDNTQTECTKKQENSRKRILELEHLFKKQCQEIGINGDKIKSEIISLAKDLPETYDKICEDAKGLHDAAELYQSTVQNKLDEGVEIKVLENLRFLIEHGNVTTYEWKYGEKPISVEQPVLDFQDEDENQAVDGQINFGDNDAEEINFGDDDNDPIDFGDAGEIDFGDSGAEIDFGDSGAEIDFGEGDDGVVLDLDGLDTSAIVVEDGGIQGGVAKDQEALSMLDNRRTRTIIVDELEELSGFLTQRLVEVSSENIKFNMVAGEQTEDPKTLRKYIDAVDLIIKRLTELKMQQLQTIRDSPSYAERLADSFKQKLQLKEQVRGHIDELKGRIDEAEEEKKRGINQMKTMQDMVKQLKSQVQEDLSERYKGRKVLISGA